MNNEMKKSAPRRATFWIIGIVAVVLVAAVIGGVFLLKGDKTTPLQRTLELIRPQLLSELDMTGGGGTLSLSATVADDILGEDCKVPQKLNITAELEDRALTGINLIVGSDDTPLDLLVTANGNTLTAASKQLFGDKRYSLTATAQALRGSVFNPEKGGKYALPRELFDSIIQLLEQTDAAQDDKPGEFADTSERLAAVIEENMLVYKANAMVTLMDGQAIMRQVTMELDNEGFRELARALQKEFEVYDLAGKLNGPVSVTGEDGTAPDFYDLKKIIDDYLNSPDDKLSLRISYAERGGYIVSCTVELVYKNEAEDESEIAEFCWYTKENVKKDPSYLVSFKLTDGGETLQANLRCTRTEGKTVTTLTCSTPTEDGTNSILELTNTYESAADGTWSNDVVISRGSKDDMATLGKLHAAGTLTVEKTKWELTLTALSMTAPDENQAMTEAFSLKSSSLRLSYDKKGKLNTAAQGETAGEPLDLMTADEKSLDDAVAAVEAGAQAWVAKLAEQLEFVKKTVGLEEKSRLTLNASALAVAFDNSRGRLYVADGTLGSGCVLKAYNAADMTLLAEKKLSRKIVSMDADNGHLAYSLGESPYKLYVVDGETLADFRAYSPSEYYQNDGDHLINIYVDGDVVFCTSEDQHINHCVIDLNSTEQPKMLNVMGLYRSVSAFDRKNHTVALMDYGISRTELHLIDLRNPEVIKSIQISSDFSSGQLYFNGTAFLAEGKYYDIAGNKLKKSQVMKNIPYENMRSSYDAVYVEDDLQILLEVYQDGSMATMVYTGQGVGTLGFETEVATSFIGRYDNSVLLLTTDGTTQSIVNCDVIEGYDIVK